MMDKEINIDLVMDHDLMGIDNVINRITTSVTETQDEFIFKTFSNWWMHETQRVISKEQLIDALTKQQPMEPRFADEWHCYCGNCNKRLSMKYKPNYCMRCGQKVKL